MHLWRKSCGHQLTERYLLVYGCYCQSLTTCWNVICLLMPWTSCSLVWFVLMVNGFKDISTLNDPLDKFITKLWSIWCVLLLAQEKSQFDVFKETFERKAARERAIEAERKKKREVQALRYLHTQIHLLFSVSMSSQGHQCLSMYILVVLTPVPLKSQI